MRCTARRRKGESTAPNPDTTELQAARFEAILRTARDAIVSIDRTGRITLFNRAAEDIFGFTADEVLGQDVVVLMPSPYREEHGDYLRAYEETGVPKAIGRIRTVEGLRKSGETFPMELSVSEVRVADEVLYTAVIRDVSERHRAEKELARLRRLSEQSQRLADIGALTAKIVHDLANPLAALSMVSQGILRRIDRSPEARVETIRPQAERVVTTAQRLDALLAEFKDFARGQRLEVGDVDLATLLAAVEAFWEAEANAAGVTLEVELPTQPVVLRGDREKLHRVFDNLLKNAIDAIGGGGGSIRVRAAEDDAGGVRVRVQDTGPGIPADIDVFALFESTKPEGTGLGLAICRQIVEGHGGTISAGSLPSGGAVFEVDLPRHGPPHGSETLVES